MAMVTFSLYPADPRPRRAADALLKQGMSVDLICLEDEKAPKRESLDGLDILRAQSCRAVAAIFHTLRTILPSFSDEYSRWGDLPISNAALVPVRQRSSDQALSDRVSRIIS